jgi:hypothetical protein
MAIFNSYVKLPEGMYMYIYLFVTIYDEYNLESRWVETTIQFVVILEKIEYGKQKQ